MPLISGEHYWGQQTRLQQEMKLLCQSEQSLAQVKKKSGCIKSILFCIHYSRVGGGGGGGLIYETEVTFSFFFFFSFLSGLF